MFVPTPSPGVNDAESLIRYRGAARSICLIEALIVRVHGYCRDRGIE